MKAEIRIAFLDDGGIEFMSRGNDSVNMIIRVGALYAQYLLRSAVRYD